MKNNKSGGGIGVLGLLQVAFVVLKLCGVINWSWVAVLLPLWIDLVVLIIAVIYLLSR